MASIYDELIHRAKWPPSTYMLSADDMKIVGKVLEPVLKFTAELQKVGLLPEAEKPQKVGDGIEARWQLADSRFLVVRAHGPIHHTVLNPHARISAGISDESGAFVGMPCCGHYAVPDDDQGSLLTHRIILEGIADLVAQYRSG